MNRDNIKIYAIVVTFNGDKWIRYCMESIINEPLISKTIVIDNQSTDETISILEQNYAFVELVKCRENLGFGQANNIGIKTALKENADYILLLNQDAWLLPGTVEHLIESFNLNPSAGIMAPLNYALNGNDLEVTFQGELNQNNCPGILNDAITGKLKETYKINWYINASAWLLTRAFLLKAGGFDPLFDHYGEDVDLCQRGKYHDYTIGLCTKGKIIHAKDNYIPKLKKKNLEFKRLIRMQWNNYLLLKLKDLDHKLIGVYLKNTANLLQNFVLNLIKGHFRLSRLHLYMLLKIHRFIFTIAKHRKITKQKKAFL